MLREYKLLFFSPEGGVFLFESFNGRRTGAGIGRKMVEVYLQPDS